MASPAGRRKNAADWVKTAVDFCEDYPEVCTADEMVKRIGRDPPKAGDRFADGYFVRIFPEIGRNTTQEKWRAKVPDGTPAAVVEQLGPSFWDNYDRQDVRCTAILEAKLDEHKRAG